MPPGESLREQVRRRLANKEPFLISRKGHAERGSGNSCAVCALVISSSEVQYAMPGQKNAVVAHLGCYLVWREEVGGGAPAARGALTTSAVPIIIIGPPVAIITFRLHRGCAAW